MEHGSHLVDILDASGKIVGQKKRVELDKRQDIHHAVFTLMITPQGELVLATVPTRQDLPNVYNQKFATTVNTIRRHQETAEQSALRAVSRELFIDDTEVMHLGESMNKYPDGRYCLETGFYMVGGAPDTFSLTDIDGLVTMTAKQMRRDITKHPQHFAPTLLNFWREYSDKLPV